MSLLNKISFESEKVIWNYFNEFNNFEQKIKNIINYDFLNYFQYNIKENNYKINLLDFLEIYSSYINTLKYTKSIRIKLKKNESMIDINSNNIIEKIKKNLDIFNVNIMEIIKLDHSDTIYILI